MTARGKYAEGKVRNFLKGWAEAHLGFCFNRILDAHSAMGAMSNPQPGDFQWFLRTGNNGLLPALPGADAASITAVGGHKFQSAPWTRNGLIEVKEVEHGYRLPHKNFGVDQVGRMRIRQLAGSEPMVLVCFREEGKKPVWRAPEFDFFLQRDGGSWDMRDMPAATTPDDFLEPYLS